MPDEQWPPEWGQNEKAALTLFLYALALAILGLDDPSVERVSTEDFLAVLIGYGNEMTSARGDRERRHHLHQLQMHLAEAMNRASRAQRQGEELGRAIDEVFGEGHN